IDREMKQKCQRPCNDGQHRRWHSGGQVGSDGVDEMVHHAVVFLAVDPGEDGATRAQETDQGLEAGLWIWQMVENSDRIDEVERSAFFAPREGRMVDVALDDVCVGQLADVGISSVDRIAKVHGDDLPGSVPARVVSVAAVPAAGVEHYLVSEEIGLDRIDPIEELRLVLVVELDELFPLPPESRRRL